METEVSTVKCPECGAEINVSDVLFHQVQEQLKKDFEAQIAAKDKEFKAKEQKLQQEKETLTKAQDALQEQVNTAVKQKLSVEKASLEKSLRKQLDEEKSEQVNALETELKEKSKQITDHNKLKADYARLQRSTEELKGQVEAEAEQRFNDLLAQEKEKIRSSESEKNQNQIKLKDKLISDLTKKVEEVTLRLEQNSNKQVGEIYEIELREFLKAEFPFDLVDDVPSGIRGADVIQTVRNNTGTISGKILFENKKTMNFSEGWIGKLKQDGRAVQANALVLVTQAFPKDKTESHIRDGVWVCSIDDLKIIVTLLRDGIVKTANAMTSQQNKGTKMEALYDFLISPQFANSVNALLENFRKTEKLIAKEKEQALKTFAEREAHLWMSKRALLELYGNISGIAADGLNQLTEQVNLLEEPARPAES